MQKWTRVIALSLINIKLGIKENLLIFTRGEFLFWSSVTVLNAKAVEVRGI